jgi:cellulose biosynthesis protein BcsQ/Flp pilus assembly protein TadD
MLAPPLGRIITFYSYKGGTGRSMALANLAWILAGCGRRVLVIDWDLEAPGLHRYFRPFLIDSELASSEGLIDMVDNYASQAIRPVEPGAKPDPNWYLEYADFSDYLLSVNFDHFGQGGKIDLLPAGRQNDAYALTVSSFNWQNFYDRLGGGGLFEAFKNQARAQYDYILIDSRTGVSDTAGICSVQMPDTLVVCFTYNNQSISGAAAVARSARKMRAKLAEERLDSHRARPETPSSLAPGIADTERPYRVFPVPMRVDSGESDRLALRQAFARSAFGEVLGHLRPGEATEYWSNVEVPHQVFYSYEEVLAPFKDDALDPKTVLGAFVRVARFVTDRDVTEYVFPIAPELKKQYLDAFARTPLTGTAVPRASLAAAAQETEDEALVRKAEAVLVRLDDEKKRQARRALCRLVRVGRAEEGGGSSSIRAALSDFDDAGREVLIKFAEAGLLTIVSAEDDRARSSGAAPGVDRTVALADERLLKSWKTLIGWIDGDRDFLIWRQQVRAYLDTWERHRRDPGTLLSGAVLGEALVWVGRRGSDLSQAERGYVETSANTSTSILKADIGAPPAPAQARSTLQTATRVGAPYELSTAARASRARVKWGLGIAAFAVLVGAASVQQLARGTRSNMGDRPGVQTTSAKLPPATNLESLKLAAIKDGEQALKDGDPLRALLSFNKLFIAGQDSATVQRGLGRANDALGRVADAATAFDRAVVLAPRDPAVFLDRGKSRVLNLDYKGAVADFDRAIDLNGKDPSAYFNRGAARENLGQAPQAIVDYSQAIFLQPLAPEPYLARARLLEKVNKPKAMADYRSVLALEGSDANLRTVAQVKLQALTGTVEAPPPGGERVLLQYTGAHDRKQVDQVRRMLGAALKPIKISEPELVSAPTGGDVRYFFTSDADLAKRVKTVTEEVLATQGHRIALRLLYPPAQRLPRAVPRTVEVWLPALPLILSY